MKVLVLSFLLISTSSFARESNLNSEQQQVLLETLNGESTQLRDFLKASKEAKRLQDEEGRTCRVVCWPCCYAPRGCELVCD